MKRPALDYAALPDVPVSQMTPAEQLIAKVAWISDNAAYGTLEAAKLLIDDIRAGSFTGATPRPSARPEALRIGATPRTNAVLSEVSSFFDPYRIVDTKLRDLSFRLEIELAQAKADLAEVDEANTRLARDRQTTPSPPRQLGSGNLTTPPIWDPCVALCRECKSDGICMKKNPHHASRPQGDASK